MYLNLSQYRKIMMINRDQLEYKIPHEWNLNKKFKFSSYEIMEKSDLVFCHINKNRIIAVKNRYGNSYEEYEVDEKELARLLLLHD